MNIKSSTITFIPQNKAEALKRYEEHKDTLKWVEESLAKTEDKVIVHSMVLESIPPIFQEKTMKFDEQGQAVYSFESQKDDIQGAGQHFESSEIVGLKDGSIQVRRDFDHDRDLATPNIVEQYIVDASGNIVVLEA